MNRSVFIPLMMVFSLLVLANSPFAQPPDTLWTKIWDYEHDNDYLNCVQALTDGGYIACGYARYYDDGNQAWTARLDNDGNEIWLHIEGGQQTDAPHFIEPTSDGGFIQGGSTYSYTPGIQFDAFIRKLDADGNQEWFWLMYTPDVFADRTNCIRELNDGGYIAVGNFGPYSMIRFNQAGVPIWRRELPESGLEPQWVEPTIDGGFLIPSSRYNAEVGYHVFTLYKVDQDGYLEWVNDEAEPDVPRRGEAYCVRQHSNGDIYACGQIITNPEWTRARFYITKRSPDGSVIWWYAMPEESGSFATHMEILADGGVVAGGWNQDGFYTERWIVKVSAHGEFQWLDSRLSGEITCIDQGRDGSIVASYYPSTLYDTSVDLALMKLEPEVDITLETWTPVIPSSGGWLTYSAQVDNILLSETVFDAWTVVTGPNGTRVPLNQFPVTIIPGQTITRPQMYVYIPATVPDGTYTFEGHIGVAPPAIPPGGPDGSHNMGYGSFTFTKGDEPRPPVEINKVD